MTASLVAALVSILLEGSAREDERDDAAMDLSAFDEPAVHAALARVATDPAGSELVTASAAESLAELWIARGAVDRAVFERLVPVARAEVVGVLGGQAPALLPDGPAVRSGEHEHVDRPAGDATVRQDGVPAGDTASPRTE